MWSRLFGKSDHQDIAPEPEDNPHLSRIDRCHELNRVTKKILLLQQHDAVLALEARSEGAGTIAYEKHIVTSGLLNNINVAINRFNSSPANKDRIAELEEVLLLLHKIGKFIHQSHDDDEDTLNVHRSVESKKRTLGLATLGVVATAISSGSFLVFLAGYAALVGATGLYQVYEEKCLDAYTFQLICDLDLIITEVKDNIQKFIDRHKVPDAIKQTVEQRTWGAIALCANQAANVLPTDVKSLIMCHVISGYEKKEHLQNLGNLQKGLFKSAKRMLDNHHVNDTDKDESAPLPGP